MIKAKKNAGFTIVEIMIVAIILAVLATIALPKYTGITERIHAKDAVNTLIEIYGSQKRYYIDYSSYTTDINVLDIEPKDTAGLFSDPIACDPASPADSSCALTTSLAEISRTSSSVSYTLQIDTDMNVTCTDPTPSNICTKIGVPLYVSSS